MSCCYTFAPYRIICTLAVLLCGLKVSAAGFLDYYRDIATAEETAVQGRYKTAIQQYELAFASHAYNNPIDCYVAAQLAAYTGDTLHCIAFLKKGISFGLPLYTIASNPHLTSYTSRNSGIMDQVTIDSCLSLYHSSIHKEARARVIGLIQRDQAVVRAPGTIYQGSKGRVLKPEYIPLWDSLLNEVIQLTRTCGFPAQKVIGTHNGDDSLFAIGPNSAFVYFILIHHGNAWSSMGPMLPEELEHGNITPQMYAAIADYSSGHADDQDLQYFALRPCDTRACRKRVQSRLAEINAARAKIGLCSYEVMEQKYKITLAYFRWCKAGPIVAEPVFDFQPDLHFTGK